MAVDSENSSIWAWKLQKLGAAPSLNLWLVDVDTFNLGGADPYPRHAFLPCQQPLVCYRRDSDIARLYT